MIGVDRAAARDFFMRCSLQAVKEKTGEKVWAEKCIVFGFLVASVVELVRFAVFSWTSYRLWAIPVVVVFALFWAFYLSRSTDGRARAYPAIIGFALFIPLSLGRYITLQTMDVWQSAFAALWLGRMTWVSAAFLLRCFVLRNSAAYDLLRPSLVHE